MERELKFSQLVTIRYNVTDLLNLNRKYCRNDIVGLTMSIEVDQYTVIEGRL